uniref:Uncharacterized protein n=1 Tax=Anguilla anguilla TaxID=7936 RepID=A0A0E9RQP6_ANGAN
MTAGFTCPLQLNTKRQKIRDFSFILENHYTPSI